MKPLLGRAQSLQVGQQHPFPWYPPVCTTISDIPEGQRSCDHVTSVKERAKLLAKVADPSMKSVSSEANNVPMAALRGSTSRTNEFAFFGSFSVK